MTPLKAALITGALAALLASFTLGGDFVMEEKNVVIEGNLALRSLGNIPGYFAGSWIEEGLGRNYYRPVVSSLYTIEYALFGLAPFGWHLVNLLLYALGAFVATLLLARVSKDPWIALAGGLLFAVHPVHVEPAAVVSYQTTLLAGLFTALGLLSFGRLLDHPSHKRHLFFLALCATAAVMSKEEGFVLPLLLAAWGLIARPEHWKRTTLWALGVTVPLLTGVFIVRAFSVTPIEVTFFAGQPSSTVVWTMLSVVVRYVEMLVVPLRLCAFYEWFIVPFEHGLSYNSVLGVAILIAITLWVALAVRRARPTIAIGLCWSLLAMIPVSQIFPFVVVAAERYLYIPSLGFSLVVGVAAVSFVRARPPKQFVPTVALLGLMAAGLATRFVVRTFDWKNDFTLNTATVRDFPQTPTPHLNLARWYEEKGDFAAAEKELKEAIRLVPGWELPRARLEALQRQIKKK